MFRIKSITLLYYAVLSVFTILFLHTDIFAEADSTALPPVSEIDTAAEIDTSHSDTTVANDGGNVESATADVVSLEKKHLTDSLIHLESQRRMLHHPVTWEKSDTFTPAKQVFTSDATVLYDIPVFRQNFVAPRIGIAGGFNRLLFLGNTSPVNTYRFGNKIIPYRFIHPYSIDHSFIDNEYESYGIAQDGTVRFAPLAEKGIVSPETILFWENGVFDENTLSFRASRPVSRTLQISIFSHYQYFENKKYSHDGNDIYTIFSNISSDTTLLSHKGYNPLVKEFYCGADILWKNEAASLISKIKYGDLSDEIPANRSFTEEHPSYFTLTQYPLLLQSTYSSTSDKFSSYHTLEGKFHINRFAINRLSGDGSANQRLTLSIQDLSGDIQAGKTFSSFDSADVSCLINRYKIGVPDSTDFQTATIKPELRYKRLFAFSKISGSGIARCGYDLFQNHGDVHQSPTWYAGSEVTLLNYVFTVYAEQDINHFYPHFDSLDTDVMLHDAYLRTGISLQRSFSFIDATAGFQYYPDPDSIGISRTWLNGIPPYRQPQAIYLVAFTTKRFRGFAIDSRLLYSETKPYAKVHSTVSYATNPYHTQQSIEANLSVDYWSKRDGIRFADTTGWNSEILSINLETAVHIKSFRLFYKIDNLLNRNFSYIPGYIAPGITFRWGFSWFIQR